MAKKYYTIRDFAGGMNSRMDARDLPENESTFIQDMSIDALGKIKTAGSLYHHKEDSDGSTDLGEYINERTASLNGSGGYGLFYFESDHSRDNTNTIIYKVGTTALTIGDGSANGDIEFIKVESRQFIGETPPELSGD